MYESHLNFLLVVQFIIFFFTLCLYLSVHPDLELSRKRGSSAVQCSAVRSALSPHLTLRPFRRTSAQLSSVHQ
jgi:hypothetical protein